MLKKVLGLPLHALRKLLGREKSSVPVATSVPAAPPPKPRPNPPAAAAAPAHEHSHDHGHGHSHERAEAPASVDASAVKIDVSDTPNPNARKFSCSVTVVEKGSMSFQSAEEGASHPIGKAIWAVPGVKGVFAVKDFVTVTKADGADWGPLTPKLIDAIRAGLAAR